MGIDLCRALDGALWCAVGLQPEGQPAHSLEVADDAASIKVPLTPDGADNYIVGAQAL